jgi:hypothetical protein
MNNSADITRNPDCQRRRRDIFVESGDDQTTSPVGAASGICRSYGAWHRSGAGFYKDVTPTAFGMDRVAITNETEAGEKTSENIIQKIFDELPVL